MLDSPLCGSAGEARFFGNGGTGGISSSSLSSCGGRGNLDDPMFNASFGCNDTEVRAEVLADDIERPEL